MMWGRDSHDMTWMGATMLFLLLVLTVSVVLLVVRLSASARPADAVATPHATLAHRLATGEISVEQYEVSREALRQGAGS